MSHGQYQKYMNSRRNGFGMNLYRNKKDKKIGGVCAGIADHFEIDHTIMRIAFVAALIFTNALALWAYIIAWVVLVPKKNTHNSVDDDRMNYEYDEDERQYRKKKMFRYRESTGERVVRAKKRMSDIVSRIDGMEKYVTSKRFELNKQFSDLEK